MSDGLHRQLCERATAWLKRQGFACVLCEPTSIYCAERPDALGVKSGDVYIIEAKTSIADFKADAKKPWRKTGYMLGDYFYYIFPEDVYGELVRTPWGVRYEYGVLLMDKDGKIKKLRDAKLRRTSNKRGAIALLAAEIMRYQKGNKSVEDFIADAEEGAQG